MWQKFKGSQDQPDAEHIAGIPSRDLGEQEHVHSSTAETSCAPNMYIATDLGQRLPSGVVRDAAAGNGVGNAVDSSAGNSRAASQPYGASATHAACLQPSDSSGISSSTLDRQPCHSVGFAQSEPDPAEAGTIGAVAVHQAAEAEQGQDAEQHASAADFRARVAARMRR